MVSRVCVRVKSPTGEGWPDRRMGATNMNGLTSLGLGDFVDSLYLLLYEGAGGGSLRFMKKHGGPLEDADCTAVFAIKHLRNKWLRHDSEHGSPGDIKKSYSQLRERLVELGFKRQPRTPSEFRGLQMRVLEEAHAFVVRLSRELDAVAEVS